MLIASTRGGWPQPPGPPNLVKTMVWGAPGAPNLMKIMVWGAAWPKTWQKPRFGSPQAQKPSKNHGLGEAPPREAPKAPRGAKRRPKS